MVEKLANKVQCNNPHWIGNNPAWDITLSNGIRHTGVTRIEIGAALRGLYNQGKLHLYDTYIDMVRQCHLDGYNLWHTTCQGAQHANG